jgi:hypothetical protein
MRACLCLTMVLLSGCWKRDTVVQPKLSFEISGEAGPVAGAKVSLMTITDPYHRRQALVDATTDVKGGASFEEKRERIWVFPLMMHGVTFYSWEWCVEAPGFAAQRSADREYPTGNIAVTLSGSAVEQTCADTENGLVVKQR